MLPSFKESQIPEWRKSLAKHLATEFVEELKQLLTAVDSSAGAERILSSVNSTSPVQWLTNSKFKKQSGAVKVGKFVFFFQSVNKGKV